MVVDAGKGDCRSTVAALLAATEAPAPHETGDAVASMPFPTGTEFIGDLRRAIGLAAIPVVEPAGRDLEVVAKHRDGMVGPHRMDPFVAFRGGSERMPNVF